MFATVPNFKAAEALHLAMQDLQRTIVRSSQVIIDCEAALDRAAALSAALDQARAAVLKSVREEALEAAPPVRRAPVSETQAAP